MFIIFIILGVLWHTTTANNKLETTGKIGNEKTGVSPHSARIIYDVSADIHGLTTTVTNLTATNSSESIFFYNINANAGEDICWRGNSNTSNTCKEFGITGLSAMMNKNANTKDVVGLSAYANPMTNESLIKLLGLNNSFLESVTVALGQNTKKCDCSDMIFGITHYLKHRLSIDNLKSYSSVKLGLEYNQHFLECCQHRKFPLVGFMDHIIFRIEPQILTDSFLSFGMFSEMMDELIIKNREFVQKVNNNCALYVRIESSHNTKDTNMIRHMELVSQFFKAWLKEKADEQLYIIRPSSQNDIILEKEDFLKKKVVAVVYGRNYSFLGKASIRDDWNCEPREIIKVIQSVTENFLLTDPVDRVVQRLVFPCRDEHGNSQKITHLQDKSLTLLFTYPYTGLSDVLSRLNGILQSRKIMASIHTIYIDSFYLNKKFHKENLTNELLLKTANKLNLKDIQIGCYADRNFNRKSSFLLSTVVSEYVKTCLETFTMSTSVLLRYSLEIHEKDELVQLLSFIHQENANYTRDYPDTTFVPMIQIASLDKGSVFVDTADGEHALYCNDELKLRNEYYEIVVNFANVHEWNSLALLPHSPHESFNGWRYLDTLSVINHSLTNFPVFMRSNSEKSAGENLPMTYTCIHWIREPEKGGIDFSMNEYSGISLTINLRLDSLSNDEIQTLLLVALGKFSVVELVAKDVVEFKQASEISKKVSKNANKTFSKQDNLAFQPAVLVNAPLEALCSPEISNLITNKHSAVHVRDWEFLLYDNANQSVCFGENFKLKGTSPNFGLLVRNCDYEVNLKFARLKKLFFFHLVKYIVCTVTLPVSHSLPVDQLTKMHLAQLSTMFYIKSYMESFLSSKRQIQVFFKINLKFSGKQCTNEIGNFLVALNQINQHSTAYKMRYFMGNAVARQGAHQCAQSWWRIKDYSDLSNGSVYVDQEDDYFGRPTKLNFVKPENASHHETKTLTNVDIPMMNVLIIMLINVLFVATFVIWFRRKGCKKGCSVEKNVSAETCVESDNNSDSLSMISPQEYKISINDLELGSLIGYGQFGKVYKGIHCRYGDVAVKIQRFDCNKEYFQSALSELKIHCYLGKHANLITFIGAYCNEISKDELSIVTEYCGNGSLQSYLRQLQSKQRKTAEAVDLNQLYTFSLQIACGMEYMAEKRVVHADLAARNVLLTADYMCKIADFGLSRRLYEMNEYKKSGKEPLPWKWMALESLNNMEFTSKSDVWSYGVTIWEIFSLGKYPYPGRSWTAGFCSELERGMRMGQPSHALADMYKNIMLSCWHNFPEERPTFEALRKYFVVAINNLEYLNLQELDT